MPRYIDADMLKKFLHEEDFETPEEAILYNQPFIDENDIEEVIELDENWYYYRCKW